MEIQKNPIQKHIKYLLVATAQMSNFSEQIGNLTIRQTFHNS